MSCGWEIRSPLGGSSTRPNRSETQVITACDTRSHPPSEQPGRLTLRLTNVGGCRRYSAVGDRPAEPVVRARPGGGPAASCAQHLAVEDQSGSGPATSTTSAAAPSASAVSAAMSRVTGTGRARASQARRESSPVKAEQGAPPVGGLHHDHRHLGLLVRSQTPGRGAEPGGGGHDRYQQLDRRSSVGARRAGSARRDRRRLGGELSRGAGSDAGPGQPPSSPGERATGVSDPVVGRCAPTA